MQLLVLAVCSIFAPVSCVSGYIFLVASGVVGLGVLSWSFVGMDSIGRFCSAFRDCAHSAFGGAQANEQAGSFARH